MKGMVSSTTIAVYAIWDGTLCQQTVKMQVVEELCGRPNWFTMCTDNTEQMEPQVKFTLLLL
jgi:hypothetical protein